MSDFDNHPLTSNQFGDHETGNASDKLRDAVEVWREIYAAWDDADPTFNDVLNQHEDDLLAASMIEADRQATRAALVAEIAEWVRDDDTVWSILKGADQYALATEIEAKWGKQ